jgi:hypothetical protein
MKYYYHCETYRLNHKKTTITMSDNEEVFNFETFSNDTPSYTACMEKPKTTSSFRTSSYATAMDDETKHNKPSQQTIRLARAFKRPFPIIIEAKKNLILGSILSPNDVNELLESMNNRWVFNNYFHGFQIKRHRIKGEYAYEVYHNYETEETAPAHRKINGWKISNI